MKKLDDIGQTPLIRLGELARIVLVARRTDKDIVFLKDLINPGKFNTVLRL